MKNYLLKIADDALILGQRLSEWCGKGPYLEEDIALTNIALDYLGQATLFYQFATQFHQDKSADDLAFLRYEKEYLNAQLVELPNGDYAKTILKVYFFSVYCKVLYQKLMLSNDDQLAGLAEKSLKEVKYHHTHTKSWLEIFAKGTEESKIRLDNALHDIWEYTGGLFDEVAGEQNLVDLSIIPYSDEVKKSWFEIVKNDFQIFGLQLPDSEFMQKGSRKGIHTEYFGYILCELQYMQRAYPGCEW